MDRMSKQGNIALRPLNRTLRSGPVYCKYYETFAVAARSNPLISTWRRYALQSYTLIKTQPMYTLHAADLVSGRAAFENALLRPLRDQILASYDGLFYDSISAPAYVPLRPISCA